VAQTQAALFKGLLFILSYLQNTYIQCGQSVQLLNIKLVVYHVTGRL
jgi:hypothetical protein